MLTKRQERWVKAAREAKRDNNGAAILFALLAYPQTEYPLKEPKNHSEVNNALKK